MGIVRCELREDPPLGLVGKQEAGADQVGHVGAGLAGIDRIALHPQLLRLLDLAVPVGALDQAHGNLVALALGQAVEVVQRRQGALGVGLNH